MKKLQLVLFWIGRYILDVVCLKNRFNNPIQVGRYSLYSLSKKKDMLIHIFPIIDSVG